MFAAVADASQVSHARRLVAAFAAQHGAPEQRVAQIALVVTELASNLVKHAKLGEILAGRFADTDGSGIEVLALDRGPGMEDVERCRQDGYSTAGSLGQGLGAITRQSDLLRIWSRPGRGTAISARFVLHPPNNVPVHVGTAVTPYPGELACGDDWAFANTQSGPTLLLADGSGHGIEAKRAAHCAVEIFAQHAADPCEDLVSRLHRALMPTRGAAVAVARIDAAAGVVRYAGLGNIAGQMLANGKLSHMVSHNGTAGHVAARIREFTYAYTGNPLLILHSDGLTSRWDLTAYPGLANQHPSLVAGVLLRDFRRGRDDASVAALRLVR
jgi:anti-sigma regulatory factor (Ser/Thr protein kinase)